MAITPNNRATEAMSKIIEAVISGLETWLTLPNNPSPEKQGGYLAVFDHRGHLGFVCRIGEVPDDKADKYFALAVEKGRRLISRYDHSSSFESRDPNADQWGGAVRMNNGWIFSFSGLPELADEALMLISGVSIRWLTHSSDLSRHSAQEVAKLNNNRFYYSLYAAMCR